MSFTARTAFTSVVLAALTRSQPLANVTVVDVEHGYLVPNVNVTIAGDRIASVGASRVATVSGKFVIPGLWDMHATRLDADTAAFQLALGITGLRDMSNAGLQQTLALYRNIEAGRVVGPRILTGGPGIRASNPAEARAEFDRVFDTNADFIHFHKDLDYEGYIALAERSRKWRYPFAGPMPPSLRLRDVLSLRQSSIEGLDRLDRLTRDEACAGFGSAASEGAWFTPLLAASLRKNPKAVPMVRLMRECKAPVLAGGGSAGLLDELEALVEFAGFSPQQALRAATVEPARFLGRQDSLGSVAPGRFADLVVLDANPLEDIANLRTVSAMVVRGKWMGREALAFLRRPPTIRTWHQSPPPAPPPAATGSAPRTPAVSSAKPPASSAKPASPTH